MSQYGVDEATGAGTRRPLVICGEGRTKQSEAAACDINQIMAQYTRTGFVTHVRQGVPTFADISEVPDYRTALDHMRRAHEYFMTLPSKVRGEFDHDPAKFVDFLAQPDMTDEKLAERGLVALDVPKPGEAVDPPADPPADPPSG